MPNIVTASPMDRSVDSIANASTVWINFPGKIYKIADKTKDVVVPNQGASKTTANAFRRAKCAMTSAVARIVRTTMLFIIEENFKLKAIRWIRGERIMIEKVLMVKKWIILTFRNVKRSWWKKFLWNLL
jgi:hypothetical protein